MPAKARAMTEREAWLELARLSVEEAKRRKEGLGLAPVTAVSFGLCGAINGDDESQEDQTLRVSDAVAHRMLRKIDAFGVSKFGRYQWEEGDNAFLWPRTPYGFRQRAKWCREQATARVPPRTRLRRSKSK